MICPACHTENDDASVGCTACGQSLPMPTPTPTLTLGTVIASRYEIIGTLGKGGMGMVFKAKDRVLDEIVALKILRPDVAGSGEMARRFRNEIKLARKVRHKNVCGIHEYNEEGGLQYIAMEYIEGIDLKRLLRERGRLPAAEAFDVAIQLAQGLDAIHDVGIIHRDLKTANAMIDAHGAVRLMDFGIAKKFDSEGSVGATAVGHIIGTPEYMSPEQARGEKIDFRADVYALGIMVFELFTGRVPFQAETPIATIFKHLQEPPPLEGPSAAGIPAALVPVLARCLAKDAEARYPTAAALAEALRATQAVACPESLTPTGAFTRGLPRSSLRGASSAPTMLSPTPAPTTPRTSTPSPGGGSFEEPATVLTATPPARPLPQPSTKSRPTTPPPLPRPAPLPTERVAARPARRSSAAPWIALGAVGIVVLAALGLAAVLWILPADEQEATPIAPRATPAPTALAVIQPPSTPAPTSATPVPPISAPTPRAVTVSATPPAVATTRPTLRLEPKSPAATPGPAPTIAAAAVPTPPPARPVAADDTAQLDIVAKPWAEVSIDGESRGRAPLAGVRLKPGAHSIVLSHPDFQPIRRKITLKAGQRQSLDIDLTWEGVRK